MAEKKQLLWLATDLNGKSYCHDIDPPFMDGEFVSIEGGQVLARVEGVSQQVPPGCKATLTIGELVDCRKSGVPELWVESSYEGRLRTYFGKETGYANGTYLPSEELLNFPRLSRCRIAWDEQGIRLIGTPERI